MSRVGWRVERLEAEHEPGTSAVSVQGWTPGPAGIATFALLGGHAELGVDVADPDQLVFLRLEDPSAPTSRHQARMLLGPDAASRLEELGPEPQQIWTRQDEARRPDTTLGWRRGTGPGGLALVGRIGLAQAELTVDGLSARAQAVGLVDAGILSHDLRADLDPHPDGLAMIRAGIERWSSLPVDAFDDLTPQVLGEILGRNGPWTKTLYAADAGRLVAQLDRLLSALRSRQEPSHTWERHAAGFDASEAGPMAPPAAAHVRASPAEREEMQAPQPRSPRHDFPVCFSPALALASPRLIAAERNKHHLIVHVGGLPGGDGEVRNGRHSGGTWLRVFEAGRRPVALSLVPFGPEGRPWRTATALIPPDVSTGQLLVDVTTEPSEPWRLPATRSTMTATIRGAAAARSTRVGSAEGADRWLDAAEAWDAAGDERRKALAEEYAQQPPDVRPLITDLL